MAQYRGGVSLALMLALSASPVMLSLPVTGWAQIDQIVVTTRKREENLQAVPIAISAISAEDLERKSFSSISDLTGLDSSVLFDEGAARSDTRISVRGLSPTRGRQNVAVLVDGIDVSSEAISNSGGGVLINTRLVDIDRVEVVKGPQSVLFGRSAFAGAIQYVTKDPSEEFTSSISVDANAEDQYSGTLSISGPVFEEKLGLRFNAAVWDEPGFYDNTITGDSLGDDEGYGLALTAKSQPTDDITLKFRAEYQDQQSGPAATAFLKFNDEVLVPEAARTPQTFGGENYPAIFRCFEQLSSFTYQQDLDLDGVSNLDARNARLYDPSYTPTGPAGAAYPNVLYSSPYCETGVATFSGAPKNFRESDIVVAPDPDTNGDFEGVDRQLIRLSLVADWTLDKGTLTSRTGYIHENADEAADNGKFAFRPDPASFSPLTGAPYADGSVNAFFLTAEKLTRQFSQELLFRTNYDGPVQATLGMLYWEEDVGNLSDSVTIQGSGSHCAWNSINGGILDVVPGQGCYGYTERAVAPMMRGGFNFTDGTPYAGIGQFKDQSPADRNTEHKSAFGMLEFEMLTSVKLTLEGRLNQETVDVVGPRFFDPDASGGPGSWNICGIFFRSCTDEFLFGPDGPFYSQANFERYSADLGYDSWNPNEPLDRDDPNGPRYRDIVPAVCRDSKVLQDRLANVDAGNPDPFDMFNPYCIETISRDDDWFSPKITLDWAISDDINTYASWAKAEKPGGFQTLGIGSSGINRELLEFEPEELMVYEVGAKTAWFDRTVIFNSAVFFQDFTDKQTLVSVLNAAGDRIVNRLENVDGAEVWGAEVDAAWAPQTPFLGGNWIVKGAYTWLDAEYVDAVTPNTSFTFISAAGNCTPRVVTALSGIQSLICDVSLDGKKLEDAPEGKFIGELRYDMPLENGMNVFGQLDFTWTDERYIEATNESYVESDTNLNLLLGLRGERWEFQGYVTNLLDDDTIYSVLGGPSLACCFILGSGIDIANRQPPEQNPALNEPGKTVTVELPAFRAAFAPDPRVVGLRFRYSFGGLN